MESIEIRNEFYSDDPSDDGHICAWLQATYENAPAIVSVRGREELSVCVIYGPVTCGLIFRERNLVTYENGNPHFLTNHVLNADETAMVIALAKTVRAYYDQINDPEYSALKTVIAKHLPTA